MEQQQYKNYNNNKKQTGHVRNKKVFQSEDKSC